MEHFVVSYDIAEDSRRTKVAKVLEDYGRRVQYSVFECLLDEGAYLQLQRKLAAVADLSEDSLRFYRICKRCQASVEILGKGMIQAHEVFKIL